MDKRMKWIWIAGGLSLVAILVCISCLVVNSKKSAQAAGSAEESSDPAAGSINMKGNGMADGLVWLKESVSMGDFIPMDVSSSSEDASDSSVSSELEETTENEYADLAIADVDRYVNIRSIPSTDGEILGKIYDGAVAQILETAGDDGDWFKVISGNVEGYIKAEYFLYGDAAAAVIDEYVTRYAQVTADRLNVREAPELSAKRIGYIDYGEKAELLENLGDWLKVSYVGGKEGYVASEYVILSEEFTYAKSIEEEREELARQRELAAREQASETDAPENTQTASGEAGATGTISVQTADLTNAELRTSIVNDAMQYLGNAYVHGGSSLAGGTDCSGFTCFIYADFGYSISRTPSGQLSGAGRSIDYSEIQPGDIICYTSNGKTCTHVGLYIGDGQIIHAANARKGVVISDAKYSTIMGVKNVID